MAPGRVVPAQVGSENPVPSCRRHWDPRLASAAGSGEAGKIESGLGWGVGAGCWSVEGRGPGQAAIGAWCEGVQGGLVGAGGGAERWLLVGVVQEGEPGAHESVVGVREEHRVGQAGVGDLVAVGVRESGDQAVFAEPVQVVGGLAGDDAGGWSGQVVGEQGA